MLALASAHAGPLIGAGMPGTDTLHGVGAMATVTVGVMATVDTGTGITAPAITTMDTIQGTMALVS